MKQACYPFETAVRLRVYNCFHVCFRYGSRIDGPNGGRSTLQKWRRPNANKKKPKVWRTGTGLTGMTTTLVSEQMPPNGWGGSCKTKNWHGSEIHVWWKNWTGRTANNVEEVLARQWDTRLEEELNWQDSEQCGGSPRTSVRDFSMQNCLCVIESNVVATQCCYRNMHLNERRK